MEIKGISLSRCISRTGKQQMCAKLGMTMMPIVSKVYCSASEVVLAVRRRPNVANGGGFVVADYGQRVVFSVDGCGVLGRKEELILRDGEGNALLLIRRKVQLIFVSITINNRPSTIYIQTFANSLRIVKFMQ